MPEARSTKNIIGPAVARIRSTRDWTQETLAAKCQLQGWDISRGVIAGIEGRHRVVEDWELLVLSEALGVSTDNLMPERKRLLENLPKPSENSVNRRREVLEKIKLRRLRAKYEKASIALREKYEKYKAENLQGSRTGPLLADLIKLQRLIEELDAGQSQSEDKGDSDH